MNICSAIRTASAKWSSSILTGCTTFYRVVFLVSLLIIAFLLPKTAGAKTDKCGCTKRGYADIPVADGAAIPYEWIKNIELLKTGATLNQRLILASIKGDATFVRGLLNQGADPASTDSDESCRVCRG